MNKLIRAKFSILAALVLVFLSSCDKNDAVMKEENVAGPNILVYGLSANNEIIEFNASNPAAFFSKNMVTGLGTGEKLMSIDFRPATGELYALSNASKLYIINPNSNSARPVGMSSFSPAISGSIASIDFNPTVDRIRLVTNTGQNLRLNPETGGVAATDAPITGSISAAVSGIAYANSRAGAATTTLFNIDQANGKLYKQDPPNDGVLVEIGNLGTGFSGQAAFDISPDNSSALLAVKVDGNSNFYKINISTGKAAMIGKLSSELIDIAIPTEPVAYAIDHSNNLLIFNPKDPFPVFKQITGLQTGESILGIDFRPANGQLYALGSSSRLYTINASSAVAAAVGTTAFTSALSGTEFGFDFNPTVDRIRVVSNTGQNLRLNPNDGTIAATDGVLNPGAPAASAAAYNNNLGGAGLGTNLYVIDASTDKLYLQNPPNNGTLVELGPLGVDISSSNGFDIGGRTNNAYLLGTTAISINLYSVNLSNGSASVLVKFPFNAKAFTIGLGF